MLSTDSGFSESVYFIAAQERMTLVNSMSEQDAPDYVMICYLSGVAVECMFHAYRMRSRVDDTAKHDLRMHADISGFYDGMTSAERQRMGEYLGEIFLRWQNNHRYRSAEALRSFIEKRRLFRIDGNRTTRQNALQFNADKMIEAADRIVTTGVLRWTLWSPL